VSLRIAPAINISYRFFVGLPVRRHCDLYYYYYITEQSRAAFNIRPAENGLL
jgi:hypothetical protein